MGNFEKLVVLTVLFLSAVVLAVSLSDGHKKAGPGSPLDVGRETTDTAGADAAPLAAAGEPRAGGTGLLLSSEVLPGGPAVEPPASAPQGAGILRDTAGLRPSGLDDYMVHTSAAGDTWAGLAERFYGSSRYVALLRHANEDMVSPRQGESILVPTVDLAAEAGTRAPLHERESAPEERAPETARAPAGEPRALRDGVGASRPEARGATDAAARPTAAADLAGAATYEVQPGDSLSGIAQKLYGSAARWNVLFEANRKLLKSPDWLQVGMKLSVPRGAALESLAAASRPAAAEPADPAAPRKAKVR